MSRLAFFSGDFQGLNVNFPVRLAFKDTTRFEMRTQIGLMFPYGAMESTPTSFMYRVLGNGEDRGTVGFREIKKTFTVADGLSPRFNKKIRYVIPHAQLVGKEGGEIEIWWFGLSSSTGPDLFIGEPHGSWVDAISGDVEGFFFF